MNKVIVIGSGLAGMTTAYYLNANGCRVTVVDRAQGPAKETSFANGSMITPSLADPWNAPGVLQVLLRSLGREDAAVLLRPAAVLGMIGWGMRFLRNSNARRFEEAYLRNVRFSQYSQRVMRELLAHRDLSFDHALDGTIKLFRDAAALQAGVKAAHFLKQANVEHRVLDVDALLDMEPALTPVAGQLAGAIAYPDDETGNARMFCEALRAVLDDEGVRFRYSEQVLRVVRSGRRLQGLVTPRGTLTADAYVLAAGSFSASLARQLGFRLPVRPAKGYSITVPMGDWERPARYPIVDDARHAAIVPVGNLIRVAGTAEFAGYDTSIVAARIDNLWSLLSQTYPEFSAARADSELHAWAGLRPMTPDGSPILGASPVENLYLNTGHGPLGWTMACGSGKVVADIVCGNECDIDLGGLGYGR
jgi:D-amino-acid dehydrogenase